MDPLGDEGLKVGAEYETSLIIVKVANGVIWAKCAKNEKYAKHARDQKVMKVKLKVRHFKKNISIALAYLHRAQQLSS